MEQVLDKVEKFAIIGTSSSGKTTLTLRILADLKRLGVLVDAVLQQDRRFCFDRAKLETHKEAQYAMIFNMVVRESEMCLKDGTDVIISDRSVLDFYAYYETMYGRSDYLFDFVTNWCESYNTLYYLQPLPYVDDGARPSDEFRTKVNKTLVNLINELRGNVNNILTISRDGVYGDILHKIKRRMSREELGFIPIILKEDCLVGGSYAFNRATRHSDVDVYIRDTSDIDIEHAQRKLRSVFGVNIEIHVVPEPIYEYNIRQGFLSLTTNSDILATSTLPLAYNHDV